MLPAWAFLKEVLPDPGTCLNSLSFCSRSTVALNAALHVCVCVCVSTGRSVGVGGSGFRSASQDHSADSGEPAARRQTEGTKQEVRPRPEVAARGAFVI